MQPDTVRVTREELYQQVWAEPMQKLAKKYGISDVALAKACRRMRVPVPGRGYWAKKQFGKAVRRTPLPKLAESAPASMREYVARAAGVETESLESPTGPVAEQERFEALEENRIHVTDVLTDPHPLVARTITALRRAKPNAKGYLAPITPTLNVHVTLDGADRAMCILDALLKALEARGFTPSIRPTPREGDRPATVVCIGEEQVAIALSERVDEVEEPAPVRASVRSRRAHPAWNPYLTSSMPAPRRALVSTGQYSLCIDHAYLGVRCVWSDGKRQRVDQSLNSFIVGLVVAAEKLKAQRLERETREREWRAAEERRAEEARRREAEAARIRALDCALAAWRDARDIRQYVVDARAVISRLGELPPDAPILAWLAWAERYADQIDPLSPEPVVPEDPGPRPPSYGYGWR